MTELIWKGKKDKVSKKKVLLNLRGMVREMLKEELREIDGLVEKILV